MIGALSPHAIPVTLFSASASERRMFAIACCGGCGNAPGSARARTCTRSDCGLSDRHHANGGNL
ncbi:MAG TPA: hypothetical protein VKQ09_05875 [Sphingomonas sp.]|nr:hypothetical protein [Sphingomonas sp.]